MFVDTHAHLYLENFENDISATIERSINDGVQKIFLPNIDFSTIEPMRKLCHQFPQNCFPMLGLHPCDVKENYESDLETILDYIKEKLNLFPENKIYAIGECGLDYYWDKTFVPQQKKALEIQAEWALEMNLPIVLHTRDSFYDTLKIIEPFAKKGLTGVFHCFSGSMEEANQLLKLDTFLMGIGGVLTYKNAGIAETIKKIPLSKIVLETDAPFLTPIPFRGKRNESAYIKIIAQKLADLREISLAEIELATTQNAMKLFQMETI